MELLALELFLVICLSRVEVSTQIVPGQRRWTSPLIYDLLMTFQAKLLFVFADSAVEHDWI